jgi:NDP-sugar pyrophosphorylase family protein
MTICAVVLAAGEGTRLRPLTQYVPKALCPVGNVPLLDNALAQLTTLGLQGPDQVAVNACHHAEQIVSAIAGRAHMSVETPPPLGTSGGVANLRDWIAGRDVLVCNADAYLVPDRRTMAGPGDTASTAADPADLVTGWDTTSVRLLVVVATPGRPGEFGNPRRWRFAGMSLLPWTVVRDLPDTPSSLVSTVWRPAEARGELELIPYPGRYLDCGTPADYLAANLLAASLLDASLRAEDRGNLDGSLIDPTATVRGQVTKGVVGADAIVDGDLTRSVVWPGGYVGPDEHLSDVIRVGQNVTVQAVS